MKSLSRRLSKVPVEWYQVQADTENRSYWSLCNVMHCKHADVRYLPVPTNQSQLDFGLEIKSRVSEFGLFFSPQQKLLNIYNIYVLWSKICSIVFIEEARYI